MNVKILCTLRKPELLPASLMVFQSLRVGYPTANVEVFLNKITDEPSKSQIILACQKAKVQHITELKHTTIHHRYIEHLVKTENEPFVLLDTDLFFWGKCEDWSFSKPLAGRLIPQFFDEFTNCITRQRLHGSHLWVDPVRVRKAMAEYHSAFPKTVFNPPQNLFYPLYFPFLMGEKRVNLFFDTCAFLYHAIGGDAFTEQQLNCFDHLNSGTISDIVGPRLTKCRLRESHWACFENPELMRGAWRHQDLYYKSNAV